MFSFIPQLLIVISIAGIIIIVVRKIPGVGTIPYLTLLRNLVLNLRRYAILGLRRLWHYTLEVKDLPKKTKAFGFPKVAFPKSLPQSLSRINLPGRNLRLFARKDSPDFYLQEAQEHLLRGDFFGAEQSYIKAIEKDEHNENAFSALGKLYLTQKKYDEAVQTFKFLANRYPKEDSYYANLGLSYHGQKHYDKAIAAFEQSITLAPENPKRYFNLAITLETLKNLPEAILNYQKAVDMDKENTEFLFALAHAFTQTGNKERAGHMYEQILILEPTNHFAREKLMQLKF